MTEDFEYAEIKAYAQLSEDVVTKFLEDSEGELPPQLSKLFSSLTREEQKLDYLTSCLDTSEPKKLFKKLLNLQTASKASAKRFFNEWLLMGGGNGNPAKALEESRVSSEDIPPLLNTDGSFKERKDLEQQSVGTIVFVVAIILNMLIRRCKELSDHEEEAENIESKLKAPVDQSEAEESQFITKWHTHVDVGEPRDSTELEEARRQLANILSMNQELQRKPRKLTELEEVQKQLAEARLVNEELQRQVDMNNGLARAAQANEELQHQMSMINGFAKAAQSNAAAETGKKGKSSNGNMNKVSDNMKDEDMHFEEESGDEDDESSEDDYRSHLSGRSTSKKRSGIVSRTQRRSLVESMIEQLKFEISQAPVDLNFFCRQIESEAGLLWCNSRGDIYRIKKISTKEGTTMNSPFKMKLVSPNWREPLGLSFDARSGFQFFMPQNFPQWKACMHEHERLLEEDDRRPDRVQLSQSKGGYVVSTRIKNIQAYIRGFREIVGYAMGGGTSLGSHPQHVQLWSIFGQFHFMFFTYAMISNRDEVLVTELKQWWVSLFEPMIRAVNYTVTIKDAATFLGYGCKKSNCRRGGMLDNYCLNCNKEDVTRLLGKSTKEDAAAGGSFEQNYQTWRAAQVSKQVTDPSKLSKKEFRNTTTVPKKQQRKDSAIISQDEYFEFLGSHQNMFTLELPSKAYLN